MHPFQQKLIVLLTTVLFYMNKVDVTE